MILSFDDDETEDIYNGKQTKKARKRLHPVLWIKAHVKLDMINKAVRLEDLRVPPNNKLEKLEKDLKGKYSIRINDQYRIIFRWDHEKRGASDVKIIDYH